MTLQLKQEQHIRHQMVHLIMDKRPAPAHLVAPEAEALTQFILNGHPANEQQEGTPRKGQEFLLSISPKD